MWPGMMRCTTSQRAKVQRATGTTSFLTGILMVAVLMATVVIDAGVAAERSTRRSAQNPDAVTFKSQKEAFSNGISHFKQGNYALALPALEFSARSGWLPAKYYLAMIFADNAAAYTDHSRAYNLYREIVETAANDTDPDDYHMAPIVSQSIVALGRYTRMGLPAIGLRADPIRAAELFNFAANRLNDQDAQYELAKMLLVGDGIAPDPVLALHFISSLAKRGHTSAQASMAEVLAQGKYAKPNMVEALAMIELALRNAPTQDRFWMAEIYQRIFCGSSHDVQKQASGLVAGWQTKYGKPSSPQANGNGLDVEVNARRECQDGVKVPEIASSTLNVPHVGREQPSSNGGVLAVERRSGDNGLAIMQGSASAAPVAGTTTSSFGFSSMPLGRR